MSTTVLFNIGDKIWVLDDAIDGVVVGLKNNQVEVETTDGFLMTYFVNEIIKQNKINDLNSLIKSNTLYKKEIDTQLTQKQKKLKEQFEKRERGVPEFDLHIEKLVKNKNRLTNFDILNIQVETAKIHIDFAIRNRIPKIILIHGVGQGILKTELDYLYKQYDQILKQEANYQKYGLGATELYFKQNNL